VFGLRCGIGLGFGWGSGFDVDLGFGGDQLVGWGFGAWARTWKPQCESRHCENFIPWTKTEVCRCVA
jgi:hypothetical protein